MLYSEARELETLKDFLVLTVENLKQRLNDLINEKEDMNALHQSDANVKEHLIERVNELEKISMERSTELLFTRRTLSQLSEEKAQLDLKATLAQKELGDQKAKSKRETKLLKEHVQRLNDENLTMTGAIENMRRFFEKVVATTGDNDTNSLLI